MSNSRNRFSPEVRARAVRMVMEHQDEHTSRWAAIESIAPKIGCATHTFIPSSTDKSLWPFNPDCGRPECLT